MSQPVELTSLDTIKEMLDKSHAAPVLLYKHSVSCPISGYAWYEVEGCLACGDAPECYRVTVQAHPELSRSLAETLAVIHHTPQVIILREGRASYVASHWQIRRQALQRALMSPGSEMEQA
jgi:bacillithiol system protein YtxJ